MTQKTVRCKALINYNEIKEFTLQEFMDFMEDFDQNHPHNNIPIRFYYKQLPQKVAGTVIIEESKFKTFLTYLYCVYRKIEMKIEQVEYSNILPDILSEASSPTKVFSNLKNGKEGYRSMDGNDFVKMYPILKRLFSRYVNYIKYSAEHEDIIDEGGKIPGTCEDMKLWLEKLNNWSLIDINKDLINPMNTRKLSAYDTLPKLYHETQII